MTPRNVLALLFAPLCLAPLAARAGGSSGSPALALAALTGAASPLVGPGEKRLLLAYLNGVANADYPGEKRFVVKADAIDCRASNVDIVAHSCTLTFGAKKIELKGRRAHELYATLVENGVAADGAAGAVHEALTDLVCDIDTAGIAEKSGGGAHCVFKP